MTGIGLDIVDVARLRDLIGRSPGFLDEYFGATERSRCRAARDPARRFATAFAAKEAFVKAVGDGVFGSARLREVELRLFDRSRPQLQLGPTARSALLAVGAREPQVTVTCDGTVAMALVILEPR